MWGLVQRVLQLAHWKRAILCCGLSWLIYLSFSTFWKCCLGRTPLYHCQRMNKKDFTFYSSLWKSFPFTNEGWTCQTNPRVYLPPHKSCGHERCTPHFVYCKLFLTSHGRQSAVITVTLVTTTHLDDQVYSTYNYRKSKERHYNRIKYCS